MKGLLTLACCVLHCLAPPAVSEECKPPRRLHLGSRSLCSAKRLAVRPGEISLLDGVAANDASPHMQDLGHELRRMGQPVEKVAVRPVDRLNSIQTLGKHCQDAAKAGRRALEQSSEGSTEEFFNRLAS